MSKNTVPGWVSSLQAIIANIASMRCGAELALKVISENQGRLTPGPVRAYYRALRVFLRGFKAWAGTMLLGCDRIITLAKTDQIITTVALKESGITVPQLGEVECKDEDEEDQKDEDQKDEEQEEVKFVQVGDFRYNPAVDVVRQVTPDNVESFLNSMYLYEVTKTLPSTLGGVPKDKPWEKWQWFPANGCGEGTWKVVKARNNATGEYLCFKCSTLEPALARTVAFSKLLHESYRQESLALAFLFRIQREYQRFFSAYADKFMRFLETGTGQAFIKPARCIIDGYAKNADGEIQNCVLPAIEKNDVLTILIGRFQVYCGKEEDKVRAKATKAQVTEVAAKAQAVIEAAKAA